MASTTSPLKVEKIYNNKDKIISHIVKKNNIKIWQLYLIANNFYFAKHNYINFAMTNIILSYNLYYYHCHIVIRLCIASKTFNGIPNVIHYLR